MAFFYFYGRDHLWFFYTTGRNSICSHLIQYMTAWELKAHCNAGPVKKLSVGNITRAAYSLKCPAAVLQKDGFRSTSAEMETYEPGCFSCGAVSPYGLNMTFLMGEHIYNGTPNEAATVLPAETPAINTGMYESSYGLGLEETLTHRMCRLMFSSFITSSNR